MSSGGGALGNVTSRAEVLTAIDNPCEFKGPMPGSYTPLNYDKEGLGPLMFSGSGIW